MQLYKSQLRKQETFVYDSLKELKEHREHMLSNGFKVASFSDKVYMENDLLEKFKIVHPNVVIHENTSSIFKPDYFIYTCTYEKDVYSNYHEEETA